MTLYIVSTPIGNLKDITFRAIEVLKDVDVIAAEDTRRTGKLLKHYDVEKKNSMVSFNDHNMRSKTNQLIEKMLAGETVALTSDAGTPGISDPGYYIIREAVKNNITVIPIPGAVAAVTGLVGSGLPMDKYFFYGFLPKTSGKKLAALKLSENKDLGSVVYYESPHRIHKTLTMLAAELPEINVCISRELTKKFEEFLRGTASEIIEAVGERTLKGEMVLILSNKK